MYLIVTYTAEKNSKNKFNDCFEMSDSLNLIDLVSIKKQIKKQYPKIKEVFIKNIELLEGSGIIESIQQKEKAKALHKS